MRLLPNFSNAELERQFQAAQNAKLSRSDAQIYLTLSSLWFGGSLWLLLRDGGFNASLRCALLGSLAWLLPWLFYQQAPQTYVKRRTLAVAAVRLCALLLPSLTYRLQQLPPDEQLNPSVASMASAVALSAQVARMWGLGLGLRLGMGAHLALHVLLSAEVVAKSAASFCATAYINNPGTLRRFWAVSRRLTSWAVMLLPAHQWRPPEAAGLPSLHHCAALVISVHFILGLFLSSVAVYVAERRSRAEFLAREAAARGLNAVQAGEALGLPVHEVLEVCLFDAVGEWVRWLTLLLPLAATTWLAVLMLAPRWLDGPQPAAASAAGP